MFEKLNRSSRSLELVVVGTDTGVGKTTVACGLLRAARRQDHVVCGIKPIETGCVVAGKGLIASDASALAAAGDGEEICWYKFPLAVAPAAAGAVDVADVVRRVADYRNRSDLLIVEGAGGLLVPLTREYTFADLVVQLGLPVVLVARDALGTINHTLLTLEALTRRGMVVAMVVLNDMGERQPVQRNAELIAYSTSVPIVSFRCGTDWDDALYAQLCAAAARGYAPPEDLETSGSASSSLCGRCARVRVVRGRNSVFLRCSEPSLAKYPRQPVHACAKFCAKTSARTVDSSSQ